MPSVISLTQLVCGRLVLEANFDADAGPDLRLQLLRQPRRHRARRQPPRLGVADQPARAAPEFDTDFRQLRRLARAGFAADNHHLIFAISSAISPRRSLTGRSS
jgi:hypothetical protein